jgi:hypothetical protein
VLDNFDIAAAGGFATAVTREFDANVTDGALTLMFGHVVENPLVSAIEVFPAGASSSLPLLVLDTEPAAQDPAAPWSNAGCALVGAPGGPTRSGPAPGPASPWSAAVLGALGGLVVARARRRRR